MARKFTRLDLSSNVEKWSKIYSHIFCILGKLFLKEKKSITDAEPFTNEEMMVERQKFTKKKNFQGSKDLSR